MVRELLLRWTGCGCCGWLMVAEVWDGGDCGVKKLPWIGRG